MTQQPTAAGNTTQAVPMTAEQRATFDRDGYLIIQGALSPDEAAAARDAIDRVYACMAKADDLGGDHAWGHDPAATPLYGTQRHVGLV
jgi:hypothetical protein